VTDFCKYCNQPSGFTWVGIGFSRTTLHSVFVLRVWFSQLLFETLFIVMLTGGHNLYIGPPRAGSCPDKKLFSGSQQGPTGKEKIRKQSRLSFERWPLPASAVNTTNHNDYIWYHRERQRHRQRSPVPGPIPYRRAPLFFTGPPPPPPVDTVHIGIQSGLKVPMHEIVASSYHAMGSNFRRSLDGALFLM
jgi:hypothetical protein